MNSGIEIVDQAYTFSIIEHSVQEDFDLSGYDLLVYMALKYFAGRKDKDGTSKCWPSVKNIAKFARCSESKTFDCLKKLEELGYLQRKQRKDGMMKMTTIYHLQGGKKVNSTVRSQDLHVVEYPGPCGGVGTPCGGDRTRSNELDPLNQNNTPLSPQRGEAKADAQQQSGIPFEEQELPRELIGKINAEFAVSSPDRLQKAVALWIASYGAEATRQGVNSAILWNVEHGHKRKSAVAFLGGWLRRDRGKTTLPDENTLSLFEEFWAHWPGVGDGKEGARQEFCRRFAALPDREAKNKGLELLSVQLRSLIDRAEEGQDPVFLGKAKNFLRDADLTG